ELSEALPEAPAPNVPPLSDGSSFSMSVRDLYRRWLFHGPLFEGIARVDLIGPSGITSALRVSTPQAWIKGVPSGRWLIDPLMFDSGLQLILLWGRAHWDMTTLPSGFQSLRRYAAPAASEVICELRIRPGTQVPNSLSDLYFLDAHSRRLIAVVEGMQGTSSKSLNRIAGGHAVAAGQLS
ncbi:MAG TPA: polyketide synthase dehydratase domain-containing protein, partial [Bryobacteraceae bacterium]|nr:polyketide synthase dehydratase domain-containing protein [Bryobacteraceae bacterium]